MKLQITGKQMDVGQALSQHVEEALHAKVKKYFPKPILAYVVFSKEKSHLFRADIVVDEGARNSITIKGSATADEPYPAFDMAADKIEKQLRRYKRKLKNHHIPGIAEISQAIEEADAKKYVISENEEEEAAEDDNPIIIADKPTKIMTLTVSDAVMHMNLSGLPALMFINKKDGNICVVYKREDGNISWVDSHMMPSAG